MGATRNHTLYAHWKKSSSKTDKDKDKDKTTTKPLTPEEQWAEIKEERYF